MAPPADLAQLRLHGLLASGAVISSADGGQRLVPVAANPSVAGTGAMLEALIAGFETHGHGVLLVDAVDRLAAAATSTRGSEEGAVEVDQGDRETEDDHDEAQLLRR